MTDKKTDKKTAKKKTPPRPKPTSNALAKRVKKLEDDVKQLKALLAGKDPATDELAILEEMTAEAPVEDAPLSQLVHKLDKLVMGKMTTKIRKTESRVKACEERLDDCEGFLLEQFPGEEEGEKADADANAS